MLKFIKNLIGLGPIGPEFSTLDPNFRLDDEERKRAIKACQTVFKTGPLLNAYELFWNKIKHENELISQRTTWFVTLQSFLFISYALTRSGLTLDRQGALLFLAITFLFAFVGIMTAVYTSVTVRAAHNASMSTSAKWVSLVSVDKEFDEIFHRIYERIAEEDLRPNHASPLPPLRGGGDFQNAGRDGTILSRLLPKVIGWVWALLFLVTVASILFENTKPGSGFYLECIEVLPPAEDNAQVPAGELRCAPI